MEKRKPTLPNPISFENTLHKVTSKYSEYALDVAFLKIAELDKPHALSDIEALIGNPGYAFHDLQNTFEAMEGAKWKEPQSSLRRTTLLSFFKHDDCPQYFIDKYAKEVFPGTKEGLHVEIERA